MVDSHKSRTGDGDANQRVGEEPNDTIGETLTGRTKTRVQESQGIRVTTFIERFYLP